MIKKTIALFTLMLCGVGHAENMRVAFTGDINSKEIALSEELENFFTNNDLLLFGNLETVIYNKDLKSVKCKSSSKNCYAFKQNERLAERLNHLGYDFLSTANNHIYDFGNDGLDSTYSALDKYNIMYSGPQQKFSYIYKTMEHNSASLRSAGMSHTSGIKKICFAAFSTNRGYQNIIEVEKSSRFVSELKSENGCNFVVVSFHGGCEGKKFTTVPGKQEFCYGENRGDVRKFAHNVIENGADVVFGHGPHVLRPTEIYKGVYIFYSLGNFSVNNRTRVDGISGESFIPILTVDEKFKVIDYEKILTQIDRGVVKIRK